MIEPAPDTVQGLILRDLLAIDRTVLANERTLLSYVRTALALVGGGIGLLKFFDGWAWAAAGGVSVAIGIAVGAWGALRFATVARRMKAARG